MGCKMYKAKVMKLPKNTWIEKNHKIGDIVDVADHTFLHWVNKGVLEKIEHYRMITGDKYKCKECGQMVIKRKKIILNW